MGFHGYWVLGVVPDEVAAGAGHWARRPETAVGELAWWRERLAARTEWLRRLPGGGAWRGDNALTLAGVFDGWRSDEPESVDQVRWELLGLLEGCAEEERCAIGASKAYPFDALAFALGPEAVERLPGWGGEFVLAAAGVREQRPVVEGLLAGAEAGRAEAWLSVMGNEDGGGTVAELFAGPVRVLRAAESAGAGAVGLVLEF
ncbi:hypothetical protein ACIHEI_37315 [Kitasatospora sp. NPDC051984]|uniref:hypothetical protein n=1 Tax=Kitasatospora sp. NPDC051984 TaxID=3364059 RepID=UPI0037C98892